MEVDSAPGLKAQRYAAAAALLSVAVGALVLAGWVLDWPLLTGLSPNWVSMKANAALCFVLIGVALLSFVRSATAVDAGRQAWRARVGVIGAALASGVGLLTLAEYGWGWDAGLDQWLFVERPGAVGTSHPGRMAPEAALLFVLLGSSLWLGHGDAPRRWRVFAPVALGLLALTLAMAGLLDHVQGGAFGWYGQTPMALHTAVLFPLLAAAIMGMLWRPARVSWALGKSATLAFAASLLLIATVDLISLGTHFRQTQISRAMARQQTQPAGAAVAQDLRHLERESESLSRLAMAVIGSGMLASLTVLLVALFRLNRSEGASRRALQTLRDSEARSRAVSENATDAIVTIDAADRIVDWNPAAERMFGHTREQACGQSLTMMMPARLRQRHSDGLRQRLDDGGRPLGGRAIEVQGLRRDGSEFALELAVSRWDTEEGQFFTGIMRDVTRRQQVQAAMKKSEQRFRDLVNTTDGIVWEADAATFQFTFVSQQVERILGFAVEDWLQPGFWVAHLHPQDRDWAPQYCASCTAKAEPHDFEYRFIAKDGRTVWLHDIVTVVTEDGAPRWLRGLMVDITQRKALEADLRKLVLAVEQSPESIVITNLAAEIEYVNQTFIRATGYAREEVIGRNPRILHSGKTPAATYASMWQALSQGQAWRGEFYNRRKDGSEYVEMALVSPIHQSDGSLTHYLAVKEDVTEKKRLAAELDQHRHHLEALVLSRTAELHAAQLRAEEANQAKSAFLANMSHEIRTPMSAILGLAHLLRTGATAQQAERLDKIGDAGRHLMSIINDVLDLSRIEAGKLQLEVRDFALDAVLDHVRSMIQAAALTKGLVVNIDPNAVPLWLRGDPTRLRQALLNYAGNAVKFTHGGTIWLRAKLLHEVDGELLVRFEVADTGIGIAPQDLARVFQAFEQGDTSTTRKYGGTGLGLAITRRLAQLMHGEVGVESTPDVGSTFWFTARLQRGHGSMDTAPLRPVAHAEAHLRLHHAGARLLLAEDNEVNREVALHLLTRVGLSVDTAADGRQALEMELAQPYDLILMDMQMPHMDGHEATRAIRALPGRERTPILALTANAFDDDRRASQDAGMNDHIIKPIDTEPLYATLLNWLNWRSSPAATPQALAVGEGTGVIAAPGAPGFGAAAAGPAARPAWPMADIAGLEPQATLAMLSGDKTAYETLLRLFAARHGDDAEQLRTELAAGSTDAALRRLHALKGASATLGAVAVQGAALALEAALRSTDAGAHQPALVERLQTALFALLAQIEMLPVPPGGGAQAGQG